MGVQSDGSTDYPDHSENMHARIAMYDVLVWEPNMIIFIYDGIILNLQHCILILLHIKCSKLLKIKF